MTAPSSGPGDIRARALGLAEHALDRSRPDEALHHLELLLATSPEDADAWMLVTRAHLLAHRTAAAADASARLVSLMPDTSVSLRLRSLALVEASDPRGALACAERAVELGPQDAWNHAVLAVVLSDGGLSKKRARHAMTQAVAFDPDDAALQVLCARIALARRDIRGARSAVRTALVLDPTDADANRMAALVDASGGGGMARAFAGQADQLRIAPGDDENLFAMGVIARTFFIRVAAIVAAGTLLGLRLWSNDRDGSPLDIVQPVAAVTAAVAVVFLAYTVLRADTAVRGYLGDVLRSPFLLGAAVASGVGVVSLVGCAAWHDPRAVWLLVPAGVGSVGGLLLARRESGTFLRRHGHRTEPWLSSTDLILMGAMTALFAVGAALLAILDPDHSGGRDRPLWALVAVVCGTLATLAFTTWRRRRQ